MAQWKPNSNGSRNENILFHDAFVEMALGHGLDEIGQHYLEYRLATLEELEAVNGAIERKQQREEEERRKKEEEIIQQLNDDL